MKEQNNYPYAVYVRDNPCIWQTFPLILDYARSDGYVYFSVLYDSFDNEEDDTGLLYNVTIPFKTEEGYYALKGVKDGSIDSVLYQYGRKWELVKLEDVYYIKDEENTRAPELIITERHKENGDFPNGKTDRSVFTLNGREYHPLATPDGLTLDEYGNPVLNRFFYWI